MHLAVTSRAKHYKKYPCLTELAEEEDLVGAGRARVEQQKAVVVEEERDELEKRRSETGNGIRTK